MNSNISKNKQNRFLGTKDLDEDEDAFKAYNIPNQKIYDKPSVIQVKSAGTTKKKKSTKTTKSDLHVPVIEETHLKQSSIQASHDSDNDITIAKESPIDSNSDEMLKLQSIDIKDNGIPPSTDNNFNHISAILTPLINSLPMMPTRLPNPLNSNLMGRFINPPFILNYNYPQQYIPNLQAYRYGLANNYNVRKSFPIPINNYQPAKLSPYYQRLEVIDALFKFIIQILRSPEQPLVEQIEYLKSLLDSLLIEKFENPTIN